MYNTKLKILLVDDDRIQLHILKTYLLDEGYDVETAQSVDGALCIMPVFLPDIVVVDYYMNPKTGIDLCREIRRLDQSKWIYIIFITAETNINVLIEAFEAGANDFMYKPVNVNELIARLLSAKRILDIIGTHVEESMNLRRYAFSLEETASTLRQLTITDPLTGLNNRRFATTKLEQVWESYIRSAETFIILSLDLDHFKRVNDRYGHDIGDEVLIHFAKVLTRTVRINDIICRMGGEEFIVISPGGTRDTAALLGNRIVSNVERDQPTHLNIDQTITISVGIAIADMTRDPDWCCILKRSDEALYDAKMNGRNRFVIS